MIRRNVKNWTTETSVDVDQIEIKRARLIQNSVTKGHYGVFYSDQWGCLAFVGTYDPKNYANILNTGLYYDGWYCIDGKPPLEVVEKIALEDIQKLRIKSKSEFQL